MLFIMPQARIYQPVHNPMQSGKAKDKWLLEYIASDCRSADDVMGWTSNDNPLTQLRMQFDSKEDAINFADHRNISYEVIEPQKSSVKIQAYADNFN